MKRRSVALAGVGLSAMLLAACVSPEENSAVGAINWDRANNGVHWVGINGDLTNKAQSWADHLARSSGGNCSMATLQHSNLAVGAPGGWRMLGENVGCRIAPGDVASFVSPLQQSFMNSPGHRANILNGSFNVTGVGLAWAPASTNNGWYVVYETQEFAQL